MHGTLNSILNTLPRLHSLRGRYLYLSLISSIFLIVSAIYGWAYVEDNSKKHIAGIKDRADASTAVNDLDQQARTLEINLQRFIILPNDKNEASVQSALSLLKASQARLEIVPWVHTDPVLSSLAGDLAVIGDDLHVEIDKLVAVRSDQMQWIPAMPIMQNTMLDHNLAFVSALELAINDVSDLAAYSGVQYRLYELLVEIRHTWQQLVMEFRLYVSNRMGIYPGTPLSGMRTRAENIGTYSSHLLALIKRTENFRKSGALSFEASESVETMRTALAGWQAGYQAVNDAFSSDKWRSDIVLLSDRIDPLFSRFREQLSTLQLELSVDTARDITQLTQIAKHLSDFVVIIATLGITFILVAFGLFNRTLLIPIAHVTHALKIVAQGMKGIEVPDSSVEEIQNLTTAFSEMRKQVQIREQHLDHLAHHDPLTSLPNRVLFRDQLEQALLRANRENTKVGLMFIDLDNFKNINDSLGHETGDKLLKCVAERLKKCLRRSDTVARLGGDEFAVVVPGLANPDLIESIAKKISNALARSFQLEQHQLHVTASIGITLYPQDEMDAEALIKDADIAMYHAKELGRNRFQFYSREMTTRILERIEIETELREALEKGQFDVFFQPIVDIRKGDIISAEALLRWHHPEQGLISAGPHITILEESGLIEPVTLWVLRKVCACYQSCKNTSRPPINISINLSGKLLRRKSFIKDILSQLEQSDMDPRHLIVEITEDTLLDDLQASSVVMRMLTDMGIRIAMDDFGTRQSSLSHLRHNPIDIVKIDKDFVQDIPHNRGDSQLVAAIIAMAHSLDMHVIAEGVEKPEQLDFLNAHECDSIQGYLFSAAVPLERLLALTEKQQWPAGHITKTQ